MFKKKFIISEFEKKNKPIAALDEAIRSLAAKAPSGTNCKTLIIGIDGVGLDKIQKMVRLGKLPVIRRLIENGVSGSLNSTIPPDSFPAWPSFSTGKNPGKHGITTYFKKIKNEDVVVNASMLNCCRYWDIFDENNLNSVVMNLPFTYPPAKIAGIMISDYLSPQGKIFSYPAELSERLTDVGYFTELSGARFFDYDLTKPQPYIYKIERTRDAAISIMKNYPWDTFTLCFVSPDKAHHMMGLDGDAIDEIYEKIDSSLGQIMEVIDSANTDIFIVSDHGVTDYKKEFALHPWLYQKGLLGLNSLKEQISQQGKAKNRLLNFVYRLKISLNLPSLPFIHFPKSVIESNSINPCPFDWGKTKAFSLLPPTSNFLPIFINTKGERPFGIVEPGGEYENLKSFLLKELNELSDSHTKEKVVKRIYEREQLFSGDYLAEMPDIVVELKDEYIGFSGYLDRGRIKNGPVFKELKSPVLDHSLEGMFIFNGPKARKNTVIENINILDMLPNFLYSRNLAIPDDVDGVVKKEIFKEEFLSENEIKIQKSPARKIPGRESWLKKHSADDIESINHELRRMGYIK